MNVCGRGVVSTTGEKTVGGATGMKDIVRDWVVEREVRGSCVGLNITPKAMGFIYSFSWVRTVGRPYSIRVRAAQNTIVSERSKPKW